MQKKVHNLTSTAPGSLVSTRTYDDSGNLATVIDPSLRVTRYRLPQPQALTIPLTGASFDADTGY